MNFVDRFQAAFPHHRDPSAGWMRRVLSGAARSWPRAMPVCETLLGIALILAASAFLAPRQWGWLGVQPHPLWIVVLAIAVRYGGWSGYAAGTLCGAAYALLMWTQPGAHLQPLSAQALLQPALMGILGAAAGEMVAARERRVAGLEAGLRESRQAVEALLERNQILDRSRIGLERQIALQSGSIATLSALGRRLQTLDRQRLHEAIVDAVSTLLEIEACALYLPEGGGFVLETGRPQNRNGRARRIRGDDPLIGRAVASRRVVSLRDCPAEASAPDGFHKLMAGPLTLSDGRRYGVVVIESASLPAVGPANAIRFELILAWAAAAVENALLCEALQAGAVIDASLLREPAVAWLFTPGVGR